jgi:hypothetical protein
MLFSTLIAEAYMRLNDSFSGPSHS